MNLVIPLKPLAESFAKIKTATKNVNISAESGAGKKETRDLHREKIRSKHCRIDFEPENTHADRHIRSKENKNFKRKVTRLE